MSFTRTTLRRDLLRFEYEMCIDMFKNTGVTKYIIKKHSLYTAKKIIECTVPEVMIALSNYLQRHSIDITFLRVIHQMKEIKNYLINIEDQYEQDREVHRFLALLNIYQII